MKKILTAVLALVLSLTCAATAFAADFDTANAESHAALYSSYQRLVDEANEQYGYSLSLVPLADLSTFYTVEEFKEILDSYCELKASPAVLSPEGQLTTRSSTVSLVQCDVTKKHDIGTVTITFTGTFDVRQNLDGSYYVYSSYFSSPSAESDNSALYYEATGSVRSRYIDGGRTRQVSQDFNVLVDNLINDTVTVSAYYYFDSTTGTVTAHPW